MLANFRVTMLTGKIINKILHSKILSIVIGFQFY